ncbi:MAG TPA: winged helix-turn-helix domain-containing protein [Gemmatimonadales bacterium]|nr:winged helix-turn-helix domain-containing protein [Gemmatimonadales bacterium]
MRILIIDDDQRSVAGARRPHLTVLRGGASAEPGQAVPAPRGRGTTASTARVLEPVTDASLIQDLLVRVHALLAEQPEAASAEPEVAPQPTPSESAIAVDLATQTVTRAGHAVRLTPTEFRLLVALMRQQGSVISRQELRRQLWGDDSDVSPRVVDVHVARLRRKLEVDPKQPRHVLTALSAGYCFRP